MSTLGVACHGRIFLPLRSTSTYANASLSISQPRTLSIDLAISVISAAWRIAI
jgi:hypothetical protein